MINLLLIFSLASFQPDYVQSMQAQWVSQTEREPQPGWSARHMADQVLALSWQADTKAAEAKIQSLLRELSTRQLSDGTWHSGWNYASPPDSSFVVRSLWLSRKIIQKVQGPQILTTSIDVLLLRAGEALLTGGIHTPNHRWLICAALAGLYEIFQDPRYLNRVQEWLGEGVEISIDGEFSERSSGIYSPLNAQNLLLLAILLKKPDLITPVQKHLEYIVHFFQEDFEIITLHSRRQDQWRIQSPSEYLWPLIYLSSPDHKANTALSVQSSAAWLLEKMISEDRLDIFTYSMLRSFDSWNYRFGTPQLPDNYTRSFLNGNLGRWKNQAWDITAYSGQDRDVRVASGYATNPSVFSVKNGDLVIDSIRMSSGLFGTGFLPADRLELKDDQIVAKAKRAVGYYQPLPEEKRNESGDYELSFEGRFAAALSFENRERSNTQGFEYEISLRPSLDRLEIHLKASLPNEVWGSMELCFRSDSLIWKGATKMEGKEKRWSIPEDQYADLITRTSSFRFSPGVAQHSRVDFWDEQYAQHQGQLVSPGDCLLLNFLGPIERNFIISKL